MGRVYEALKRAAEQSGNTADQRQNEAPDQNEVNDKVRREEDDHRRHPQQHHRDATVVARGNGSGNSGEGPGRLWERMPLFTPDAARVSASTAHTDAVVGSALPDGSASRAAGATLDAVGAPRAAVNFASREVAAARVEPHLIAITHPRSPESEKYRSLRTHVLHASEERQMQAFVITSAGAMEGKTMTALNLSWLLAQTDGVRALLIDGDLRHPCANDYLGIGQAPGLSEVLAGEATLNDTILRLEPSGLHLLPGGAARDDVAELLSGPKFSQVLSEVRRMFNYIVIDAPPLGIFTDATVLINRADAALMVVRSGKTRYATLERLLEPLPSERILGVVLNGANEHSSENNYYKHRYYRREEKVETAGAPTVREEEKEEAGVF